MTVGAVLEIELPRGFDLLVFGQVGSPGHLVRVDVEDPRLGVERGTAPFRSTVESWEDERFLADPEGHERRAAVERSETLHGPAVRLGSPIGQHVLRQDLPGKRRGFRGQWLGLSRYLAGYIAWRILTVFDGEEGLPVPSLEDVHMSGLGGLGNGVHPPPPALDSNESRL